MHRNDRSQPMFLCKMPYFESQYIYLFNKKINIQQELDSMHLDDHKLIIQKKRYKPEYSQI